MSAGLFILRRMAEALSISPITRDNSLACEYRLFLDICIDYIRNIFYNKFKNRFTYDILLADI